MAGRGGIKEWEAFEDKPEYKDDKIVLRLHPRLLRTTDMSNKPLTTAEDKKGKEDKRAPKKDYPTEKLDPYVAIDRVQRMLSAIAQEVQDEVREIDRENEQLYQQEKEKLFAEKVDIITRQYQRMEDKLKNQLVRETSRMIHSGNMAVQSVALEMLEVVRNIVLQKIDAMFNNAAHKIICEKLILVLTVQASTRLAEPESLLIVRQRDMEAARSVLPKVRQKLRQLLGKRYIDTYLCDEHYLPNDRIGGVALYNLCGTIWVSNTFKDRVDDVLTRHLQELRTIFYGPNPNRAFLE